MRKHYASKTLIAKYSAFYLGAVLNSESTVLPYLI